MTRGQWVRYAIYVTLLTTWGIVLAALNPLLAALACGPCFVLGATFGIAVSEVNGRQGKHRDTP